MTRYQLLAANIRAFTPALTPGGECMRQSKKAIATATLIVKMCSVNTTITGGFRL
jgi:hypothetical protein